MCRRKGYILDCTERDRKLKIEDQRRFFSFFGRCCDYTCMTMMAIRMMTTIFFLLVNQRQQRVEYFVSL